MAVDYGAKRIGLAVGDDETRVATPLSMISGLGSPKKDAASLMRQVDEYGPDVIVIGLPLHMDGTEGEQAKVTRAFACAVEALYDGRVELIDERLSSRGADELLSQSSMSRDRKKQRRDSVAAMIILQAFLERPPSSPS